MLLPRGSYLIRSRIIRLDLWKRAQSTSTPPTRRSLWSRFGTWFRYTFGEAHEIAFSREVVELAHKKDKLSPIEWLLVYNDAMYVRFRFLMYFLLASAVSLPGYALQDYKKHNGKFSNEHLETLRKHAYDAGDAIYPILFLMTCSFSAIVRTLQIRTYRIYQNIQDPLKYYVFRSKSLVFTEWAIIPRSAIKTTDVMYDFAERSVTMGRGRRALRRQFLGNVIFGNRRAIVEEPFFRSHNVRTFMLHETMTVPKQITDIQTKLLEAGRKT